METPIREVNLMPMSILLLSLGACKGRIDLGQGPEPDARLTSDVFTWPCVDPSNGRHLEGVYAFTVSLEFAPDQLTDRSLPEPGECAAKLSMFPKDAGEWGLDVGVDSPAWTTASDEGVLDRQAEGFYVDQVFENRHTCLPAATVLESGVELTDAGLLTGAGTPPPGDVVQVDASSEVEEGLVFGEGVDLRWVSSGWDESWIQVRMERDGQAWDTVTCNTTGLDSFSVDDSVWSLLDERLNVEIINLYTGFQNTGTYRTEDGLKVSTATRAVAVSVVQEQAR